jgi:hypothetical protein
LCGSCARSHASRRRTRHYCRCHDALSPGRRRRNESGGGPIPTILRPRSHAWQLRIVDRQHLPCGRLMRHKRDRVRAGTKSRAAVEGDLLDVGLLCGVEGAGRGARRPGYCWSQDAVYLDGVRCDEGADDSKHGYRVALWGVKGVKGMDEETRAHLKFE